MRNRGTTGILVFFLFTSLLWGRNYVFASNHNNNPNNNGQGNPHNPTATVTPTTTTGVKTISVHQSSLTDHECNATEWHFVINQIDTETNAPLTITVNWQNGASEAVPLDKFTGGVAHYITISNLDSVVTSATVVIYSLWDGQFNLSHGPCNNVTPTGVTTTPTQTPTNTPTPTEEVCHEDCDPTATPTPTNPPAGGPTATPEPGRGGAAPVISPTAPALAQGGGQVLGASTFAATGQLEDTLINFMFLVGFALLAYSGFAFTHVQKKDR